MRGMDAMNQLFAILALLVGVLLMVHVKMTNVKTAVDPAEVARDLAPMRDRGTAGGH
jgi:hypothetical protein